MKIPAFIYILIGCCLGGVLTYTIHEIGTRKMAVENECGHYDYHTGEFAWNVSRPTQDILEKGAPELYLSRTLPSKETRNKYLIEAPVGSIGVVKSQPR